MDRQQYGYATQMESVPDPSTASYQADASGVNDRTMSPVVTAAFPGVGGVGYVLMQVPNQLLNTIQPVPAPTSTQSSPPLRDTTDAGALLNASVQSIPVPAVDNSPYQGTSAEDYYYPYGPPVACSTSPNYSPQPAEQNRPYANAGFLNSGATRSAPFLRDAAQPQSQQPLVTYPSSSAASLPPQRPKTAQPFYRRECIMVGYPSSEPTPDYETGNYMTPSSPARHPAPDRKAMRHRGPDDCVGPTQRLPPDQKKQDITASTEKLSGTYYLSNGQITFDPPLHVASQPPVHCVPPQESKVPPQDSKESTKRRCPPGPERQKAETHDDDSMIWTPAPKNEWVQTPREWIKGPVSDELDQTPCGWEGGAAVAETGVPPEYCASSCPTTHDLGMRRKKRTKLCCDTCKEARKAAKNKKLLEQEKDPSTGSKTALLQTSSKQLKKKEDASSQNASQTSIPGQKSQITEERRTSTGSGQSDSKGGKRTRVSVPNPP